MGEESNVEYFLIRAPHMSRPGARPVDFSESCMSSISIAVPKDMGWQAAYDTVLGHIVGEFARYGVHEILAAAGIKHPSASPPDTKETE